VIVLKSLMSTCNEGPAVERITNGVADHGALWGSDPLPPKTPASMYFLALSQAAAAAVHHKPRDQ
jgi:hypothetical protein